MRAIIGLSLASLCLCATAANADECKYHVEKVQHGRLVADLYLPESTHKVPVVIAIAEDAEEEVSVSDRFGLWIGFPPMDQDAYLQAVRSYAGRFDLQTKDLERRALQWSQLRGARSGRVAWQFIRDLAGELGRELPL